MSLEQEYEDFKWATEQLLEICEEWYPDYDTNGVIEDCLKILKQYE